MKDFVKKFTDQEIDFIKVKGKYFMADKKLLKVKESLDFEPMACGVFLGEKKGGKFIPSLALLSLLSKTSKEKVFVNDMGELDFVYRRDLKPRHVDRIEGETKDGFLKLVQNKRDENIGYVKITKKGSILKNKLDHGDFLRRER